MEVKSYLDFKRENKNKKEKAIGYLCTNRNCRNTQYEEYEA